MMNVFIVEDEVSLGKMMAQFLSQLGHRVIFVSSAEKAIEILRKMDSYSGVFLVDMHLGGMDGAEFITWLREHGIYN